MAITKRLLIQGSSKYGTDYTTIPVNTQTSIDIESDIGLFSLSIYIRNFDGSKLHQANSFYNVGDKTYLNGSAAEASTSLTDLPNLRIVIKFTPKIPISGSELLFGNDCTVPIRDYVPTTLLATGLKFFSWFINPTVKGDVYNDSPYLYGLTLNSFTKITLPSADSGEALEESEKAVAQENLNKNVDNILSIPTKPKDRQKFFCKVSNCESFTFNDSTPYLFQFDTDFVRMGDSKYHVAIPTYGNRTFDINVSRYANLKLNNFNWIIKQGGYEGVGHGSLGLVLNFSLIDEE